MHVIEALKRYEIEESGAYDGIDEEFDETRQRVPELEMTLEDFARLDEAKQIETLVRYLEVWWEEALAEVPAKPGELERSAKKCLAAILDGSRPEARRGGDKWTSPGRLVLTWPDLDLTALAVALVMAAHGDNNGENIFISQKSISEYVGRDRTTVYRAIKRLERRGVITMTAKPRQHRPATYRINRGPRAV